MPTTTHYGLVTPGYGDDPDGPAFFQDFAQQIDNALYAIDQARIAQDATVMAARAHSAAISCTTAVPTLVPYNTMLVDDGIPWDTDHFTIPITGYYMITMLSTWANNTAGFRTAHLRVNGTAVAASQVASAASGGVTPAIAETMKLTAGQQVSAAVTQNSGVTLATAGGVLWNRFSIVRVRS